MSLVFFPICYPSQFILFEMKNLRHLKDKQISLECCSCASRTVSLGFSGWGISSISELNMGFPDRKPGSGSP